MKWLAFCCSLFISFALFSTPVFATPDLRLILLVGNEEGWQGEERLKGITTNDLPRLARAFQKLGFRILTVENKDAAYLRKVFQQVTHLVKKEHIKTFFFYYTGHADQDVLHLGPRRGNPLRYEEFLDFFLKLRVKRRFAVFDSCFGGKLIRKVSQMSGIQDHLIVAKGFFQHKLSRAIHQKAKQSHRGYKHLKHLLSQGLLHKGLDNRRGIDTRNIALQSEQNSGIHLLATRGKAYHDRRRQTSLLTHLLLEGLSGKADRGKTQNGVISVEELFTYCKQSLLTYNQLVEKIGLFVGTYELAPNYQGRIIIPSHMVGTFYIKVGRFTWPVSKRQQRKSLELMVGSGNGYVLWESEGTCRKKTFLSQKDKPILLPYSARQWQKSTCRPRSILAKGGVSLSPLVYHPPPRESRWHLSLQLGAGYTAALGGASLGGSLHLHHHLPDSWLALGVIADLQISPTTVLAPSLRQEMLVQIRGKAGYHLNARALELFAGAYLGTGVLLQDWSKAAAAGMLFSYGITATLGYLWPDSYIGISLSLDAGFTVLFLGNQLVNLPGIYAQVGMTFPL